ncbi:MAG: MFS transporter [Planctomycetaceae bacterium]
MPVVDTDVTQTAHITGHRWRIIALLMGYAAIGHFNRVGISVAGDEVFIPTLGITETRMGWVYTAFLIVYTIGMLPGGWLIDRIGSARALTLFGVGMGVFVVLTGALGWTNTSPEILWLSLLVIRGLAGLFNAPLHPGAAHVVADLIPNKRQATANGMITAGALVGIACCYPTLGWLIDTITWQWAFVISGSMLIAYGLLWKLLASPSLPHHHPTADPTNQPSPSAWRLFGNGNLWLLTISYATYGYFQYLFLYWMGYYFKEVLQVPDVQARWASFWIMLAMGAGMAFGGQATDTCCRWLGTSAGRRLIVITGMCMGAVFGLIGVNIDGLLGVSVSLAISMAAVGMCESVFWTTATDIGGKSRGVAAAFMNTGGNLGGLVSPVLTPFMAAKIGWPAAIAVACGISSVGGAMWFLIKPDGQPKVTR